MIYKRKILQQLISVFSAAIKKFLQDDCIKLSASLSYYTIFAMGPLVLIIISLAGIFFGREAAQGKIFGQIKGLVGPSAAYQLQSTIANIEKSDNGIAGTIIGIVILLIGATGVFTEIQGSINYIWSIRAKPKKGWHKLVINRVLSISILIATSFILMVALIVNALIDLLNSRVAHLFPQVAVYVLYTLNLVVIFFVITLLFTLIFKALPDAIVCWKDAAIGASLTAVLFLLGKVLIGVYLGNADFGFTYGAAASIMILLAWVYYSAVILYFGASFTREFAQEFGRQIIPNKDAVYIIKTESREVPLIT